MKKALIILLVLLIPSLAFAGNTSWVKGGAAWGDLSACIYETDDNSRIGTFGSSACQDVDTENEFFVQISPVNIRGKINGSKFGYRMEPYFGYSQMKGSINDTELDNVDRAAKDADDLLDPPLGVTPFYPLINRGNDITIKNIQFGVNLFVDAEVIPKLTVYGGPTLGFEVNEITSRESINQAESAGDPLDILNFPAQESINSDRIYDTGFDSNFFWGAEVGAEYKILSNVALGGFMQWINHDVNIHSDVAEGMTANLGTETRAGVGITYYWN